MSMHRLSFYFGYPKKKVHKKERPLFRRLWNAVTLQFDKKKFEANFDEAFCYQSMYRYLKLTLSLHNSQCE